MRMTPRLATAALAVALVAGIGLAGSPAQAKTTTTVSGAARLPFLMSTISELSLAGTQFDATPPATSEGDGANSKTLVFPISRLPKNGVLPLDGGMSIGASVARLYLTAPRLEYSTDAGRGRITFEVVDMPADGPADLANGTRIALLNVSRLAVKTTRGRVTGSGKEWKRIDTQRIAGRVYLADDATLLTSINTYIGSTFFTPKRPFSKLSTVITTTVTCSTRAECK